jgi:hypothetical protein
MRDTIVLDCSPCVGHERPECDDCLVRFVVESGVAEHSSLVVDGEALRAVRLLAEAGLLADVRPLRRAG